jgi:hypothetical protein
MVVEVVLEVLVRVVVQLGIEVVVEVVELVVVVGVVVVVVVVVVELSEVVIQGFGTTYVWTTSMNKLTQQRPLKYLRSVWA